MRIMKNTNISIKLIFILLTGCRTNKNIEKSSFFPEITERPASIPEKENLWVFILAGQSNMAGRAIIEPDDTIPDKRIFSLNSDDELILAKEPLHYYEPGLAGLDCGVSFARALLKKVHEDVSVLVIPASVGGSSVKQWLNDSVHRNVSLYSNFRNKMETGKKYGVIKGILWHQGENDAGSVQTIEIYGNKLKKLVELFRKEAGNPDLPVLIGELGSFSENNENWQAVNKKIDEYVKTDTNAYLIKTGDLKDKGDKVHFNSKGQRKMGKRFARKFLSAHQ